MNVFMYVYSQNVKYSMSRVIREKSVKICYFPMLLGKCMSECEYFTNAHSGGKMSIYNREVRFPMTVDSR